MIYLRCTTKTLRQRIKLRGREYEQAIPAPTSRPLDKLYEEWFARTTSRRRS